MRRHTGLVCASALVLAALACASSQSSGTDISGRATALAQTAAALLTATAAANVTPATPAPLPSNTPAATATPTATPTGTSIPPATPSLTLAPASPTLCATNDSDFVADVNVPDGTHFAGGTAFVKTWRLRNSGTCPWTTAYQLRLIEGDSMGSAPVNLPAEAPPGAEAEISVSFVAPSGGGTYRSQWQLFTSDGVPFGTKPFVLINVP